MLCRRYNRILIQLPLLILPAACLVPGIAWGQLTPPVAPKSVETPLPPAVELPAPATAPDDLPRRPLTADEAAGIALRHHSSVAAARAAVSASAGRTRQAQAALKPTLSAGAGYTRAEELITEAGRATSGGTGSTLSTSTGMQASVSVRRLLWDQRHSRDLVSQALSQEQGAEESLARSQADLVLQVKQAFYTYLQNTRLVGIHEANLRNQQEHLGRAQARLKAGVGLPLDVVRAQTAVSEATLNLTVARSNVSTSRVSLALAMGLDPRTPIEAAESAESAVEAKSFEAMVDSALAQRPEVRQGETAVTTARHALNAARTTDAPVVAATLGLAGRSTSVPPLNHFASATVQLSWSPFDGGVKEGRVREAQAGIEAAEAQTEGARRTVIAEVSQAYLSLHTSEQRVVTADAGIANAEESLRLATGRYSAGMGTFLDVLDAQAALLTARTNRINADAAIAQARAALARAVGTPPLAGK